MSNTVTYKTYMGNRKGTLEVPAFFSDTLINRQVAIKEDGTMIQVVNTSLPGRSPYRTVTVQNIADTTWDQDYMRPIDEHEFNMAYNKCLQDITKEVATATAYDEQ